MESDADPFNSCVDFLIMQSHILLANKFCQGEYDLNADGETWGAVFEYMSNNLNDMQFNKAKVHTLWTVNGGHLRRKIRNDELILTVLKASLPGYQGSSMILYRGECRFLFDENKIGFCWSPDIEVASKFARGLNALESGGVLLKTFAPKAILSAGMCNA